MTFITTTVKLLNNNFMGIKTHINSLISDMTNLLLMDWIIKSIRSYERKKITYYSLLSLAGIPTRIIRYAYLFLYL